jgi:hypothetical protein
MHKKSLPHVLYCAVWRWEDVTSHRQLRAIAACRHPFEAKLNVVCVNPYHYERTGNGGNVSKSKLPPPHGFILQQQQQVGVAIACRATRIIVSSQSGLTFEATSVSYLIEA